MNYLLLEKKTKEDSYKKLPMLTLNSLQETVDLVELITLYKKRDFPDFRVKFVALSDREAKEHNAKYKWLYD